MSCSLFSGAELKRQQKNHANWTLSAKPMLSAQIMSLSSNEEKDVIWMSPSFISKFFCAKLLLFARAWMKVESHKSSSLSCRPVSKHIHIPDLSILWVAWTWCKYSYIVSLLLWLCDWWSDTFQEMREREKVIPKVTFQFRTDKEVASSLRLLFSTRWKYLLQEKDLCAGSARQWLYFLYFNLQSSVNSYLCTYSHSH